MTGISGRRPGDELIGLAQAALRNGTRSVIATLWETFDESSAVFFEHFYDALAEGDSVSTAIAAGMYALSTDPGEYDHPVDWAPFLLIGDPNQRIVDPDRTPMGAFNHGVRLAQEGDKQGARAAFQLAIDSGSAEAAPRAAFSLGMLRSEEGDTEGALAAFQVAALSGDPDMAPRAMYCIGLLLADRDDVEGARAAYQQAIDSGHAGIAPMAANNLGGLLATHADIEGARAAFQQAIDSGDSDAAPMAANNLGVLLADQGDIENARTAFQYAIDSAHSRSPREPQARLERCSASMEISQALGWPCRPRSTAATRW